jgi:heme A synthase
MGRVPCALRVNGLFIRGSLTMTKTASNVSWLHRFGSLVAVMAFALYITGVLASGATPNFLATLWTTPGASNPSFTAPPPRYAHAFMVLGATVCVLSVILALWLWKSNYQRYLKNLGMITVGVFLVVALVVLSPLHNLFPVAASVGYALGIQIFFCLAVCLALFTRADWRWDELKMPDLESPSMRQVLVFTTTAVFVQPLLAEGFRKKEIGIAPHLVLGIAATACSLWILEMALTKFSHLRAFKISAVFLAQVVGLQLFLGIISLSMNLNARAVPGPQPGLVVMNVTQAAVGILALVTSLFVTCQGFKYFGPPGDGTFSAMLSDRQ